MLRRLIFSGFLLLVAAFSGCTVPHMVDTVPAWKGIPLMVIEPTSQEGQVWHDYFRERKEQRRAAACCPATPVAASSSEGDAGV